MARNKWRNRSGGNGGGGNFNNHQNQNQPNGKDNHRKINNKGNRQNYYCQNCGNNNTHDTSSCRRFNNHNNNNRVNKNKNWGNDNHSQKNHKSQRRERVDDQKSPKNPCFRCGFGGHTAQNCTAKEIPSENWCECGCEYHYSNQCPWNKDSLEREQIRDQETGKICQWCKSDGDGTHDFNQCREHVKFKNTLMSTILKSYDDLLWCWHCSKEDHKTKACTAAASQLERDRWKAKIIDIIEEWRSEDLSDPTIRYLEQDEDVLMGMPVPAGMKAPVASEFPWCIFCDAFGHTANSGMTCDRSDYDRRCPTAFQNAVIPSKQPFIPSSGSRRNVILDKNSKIPVQCINPTCKQWHSFNRAVGQMSENIWCTSCGWWNPHPTARKHSIESFAEKLHILKNSLDSDESLLRFLGIEPTKKNKAQSWDLEPYKHRPSTLLSQTNVLNYWPDKMPFHTDLGARGENGNSFYRDIFDLGSVDQKYIIQAPEGTFAFPLYNSPGNAQSYFPAIKVRLNAEHLEQHINPELPINRAGSYGAVPMCQNCEVAAVVWDSEGDAVMCGTDPNNTLGCGTGLLKWGNMVTASLVRAVAGKFMQGRFTVGYFYQKRPTDPG
ncbi:hypothetical protein CC78DRAFT_586530 [Lojkania enalia]|uniref:CCHC-type domain-containing protein n=1 Tax=Lojkania enalia TaxID=147567 RepID=A0A9P4K3U0_9PLEO|nr:hypothetical protein CC78DRAFT_586530 [Didymosphaeria enalia]